MLRLCAKSPQSTEPTETQSRSQPAAMCRRRHLCVQVSTVSHFILSRGKVSAILPLGWGGVGWGGAASKSPPAHMVPPNRKAALGRGRLYRDNNPHSGSVDLVEVYDGQKEV